MAFLMEKIMIKLVQSIKNLWGGWIDFAPKFLLALLAFALLTIFVQLSQSVSRASVFPEGGSVSVGCSNGNPGQLTKAALVYHTFSSKEAIDEYFNSPTDEKVKQLIGMAPGSDGTGGGCDINGNSCKMADNGGCTADKNGNCEATAGIPSCAVAQLDCLGGANGGAIKFNREGCAAPQSHLICENNACKKVDGAGSNQGGCTREGQSCGQQPKVTCDNLVLEKLAGGQFRVKATVSGHGSDGGKIVKYRYTFGDGSGNFETQAPDNAKKHDYAGPGTYTVKGYVIGENGQVDGGASCEKNITFTQDNKSVACDNVSITRLAGRGVRLVVNGHGVNGGVISKYRFNFGQGPVVDRNVPDNSEDYTYTADGTYHLTGSVIDDQGAVVTSGGCQGDITITTTTPRVVCDNVNVLKIGGRSVRFTVNGHGENGGVISKYRFNFGQGPVVDRNAPDNIEEYTYTADGTYVLTGSVIDSNNNVVSGGACQTSVEFRTEPNFYCDVNNYRCIQCVPGSAGYDACKNKPSCTNDAQCTPQTNYYCDNNYACVSCVPGSANYNECKNKPTCSTQDDCKVNSNFYCNDTKSCVECKPGSANYNDCKNKPSCANDDSCKTQEQSYYACNENNTCQKYNGVGTSSCNPGSDDCSYHNECVGTTCARIKGAYRGGAFCSSDSMCQPVVNQSTYCDWLFVDPQTGNVGLTVNAQIAGHTINGGSISQYRFNFGDGTGDTVQSSDKLSHSFGQTGTYVISGAVIDNRGIQAGGSGACQKVVQVVPSGVTPPPPTGKGGVPSTGAETILLPLFSLLGTFGWAMKRVRGN